MKKVTNFVLFQLGWLVAVAGAAWGYPWAGPAAALVLLSVHLWLTDSPRAELVLVAVAAVLGTAWDSLLIVGGLLDYPEWSYLVAPIWITALWVMFACTLNESLAWLKGRFQLAIGFGAIGGPLAYFAAERLGAVTIVEPLQLALALGVGWAVFTPLLLWLGSYLSMQVFPVASGVKH